MRVDRRAYENSVAGVATFGLTIGADTLDSQLSSRSERDSYRVVVDMIDADTIETFIVPNDWK